jgi:Lipocalin-like domain
MRLAACRLAFILICVPSLCAMAQTTTASLAGTWKLTAADVQKPDGTVAPDFGPAPSGLLMMTADGHYMVEIYRSDRQNFAANDRTKGTPDEYRLASLGMSCHFGTFSVDAAKGTLTFHIESASFPNWNGAVQVRSFELKGDQLSWRVPPRPDGSIPISRFQRLDTTSAQAR